MYRFQQCTKYYKSCDSLPFSKYIPN
uniref:Uncharacterized protein n=1 Tax=Arundo donax TaxID=35708 RepID=A0A0A8Y396_ARUDO